MSYILPLYSQFDGSAHAGANCSFVACHQGLLDATDGAVNIPPEQLRAFASPVSGPGDAANTTDVKQAWDACIPEALRLDWRLKPAIRQSPGQWQDVIDALDAGYGVELAVSYATINRLRPRLSGDPNYGKGHALYLGRIQHAAGRTRVKVWDSLCDGRRPGIPHGPQWYPAYVLEHAAEDWSGAGTASFVIFKPGQYLNEQPPKPSPVQALKDRIAVLEQALGIARAALQSNSDEAIAAQDEIDALLRPLSNDPEATAGVGVGEESHP